MHTVLIRDGEDPNRHPYLLKAVREALRRLLARLLP